MNHIQRFSQVRQAAGRHRRFWTLSSTSISITLTTLWFSALLYDGIRPTSEDLGFGAMILSFVSSLEATCSNSSRGYNRRFLAKRPCSSSMTWLPTKLLINAANLCSSLPSLDDIGSTVCGFWRRVTQPSRKICVVKKRWFSYGTPQKSLTSKW